MKDPPIATVSKLLKFQKAHPESWRMCLYHLKGMTPGDFHIACIFEDLNLKKINSIHIFSVLKSVRDMAVISIIAIMMDICIIWDGDINEL